MDNPILGMEEREAINSGRWFSSLSPSLRHDILRCAYVKRFRDGELIAACGTESQLKRYVEKMLNENRDKISGSDVSNLESAISEARKAMEQGGADNLKRATENLTKASHKLAEAMYQQGGSQAGGQQGAPQQPSGGDGQAKDDVIEAEVVDETK